MSRHAGDIDDPLREHVTQDRVIHRIRACREQPRTCVVRDNGKFSTNAVIKHVFNIANNIGFIGTDLTYCVPLRIHYTDGSVWNNPHLPERPPV